MPTTGVSEGTSRVTTECAPITEFDPIVTLGMIVAVWPTQTFVSDVHRRLSSTRAGVERVEATVENGSVIRDQDVVTHTNFASCDEGRRLH